MDRAAIKRIENPLPGTVTIQAPFRNASTPHAHTDSYPGTRSDYEFVEEISTRRPTKSYAEHRSLATPATMDLWHRHRHERLLRRQSACPARSPVYVLASR